MKVLCARERLREGLTVVTSVIPLKSTRPAIENVCLVASDDMLELVGTDLDVAVRYRVADVKVEEPGTALIPARVAADFVRDLTGDTVRLRSKGNGEGFVIESGPDDRCELTTVDPDEYPVVARFIEEGSLPVLGAKFTRLVARTSFAAAREAGRYAMHGILTELEGDELRMIATDGRRLVLAKAPVEASAGGIQRAIVPTKGMMLFCKVIDDPTEMVRIHFGENQFGLKTSKAEVYARLIDGEFPRYSAVIPAMTQNTFEADAQALHQKLKLVANVTSADTRAVKLSIGKERITIYGRSAAMGEASASLDVIFDGKPTDIAFNPDYLIDGLKNCELQNVRFEFNEKNNPGKFTLGEDYTYVVMPITIDT
ncbi:MAG: DNA polymerase III subunit beta [Planctomycetes bacterium]|nr:DNA polymerase III subunit beta [Planctomycetota bacterium]